mgnify:CR=1 FL=1
MSSLSPNTNRPIDIIAGLLIAFGLLVTSAISGVFIAYPLAAALCLLVLILLNRGFGLKALFKMGFAGAHQALPVVKVLLLIGILTAVWMSAGTVPALVYYSTGLVSGQFFLLWAFVLTGIVSTLIGTSIGAVGTIGVALMVIARGSGQAALVAPLAGAIIAGAFVGDRCSPMSSSAHLVASITQTNLYTNLRNMVRSSVGPLALSVAFYTVLSFLHPVQLTETPITASLPSFFNLSPIVLLPAITIFLLSLLKVEVKLAMLASIGTAIPIACALQNNSLADLFQFSIWGYQLNPQLNLKTGLVTEPITEQAVAQGIALQSILLGGGLLPMLKATIAVFISTAFAGILIRSQSLQFLNRWLGANGAATPSEYRKQTQLAQTTTFVSLITNLFGCTQTIAIVMTGQIMQPHYHRWNSTKTSANIADGNEKLALTIEDTAVVIAPLIPWNIASLIPATILDVGPGFIPYALYLFLLPLFVLAGIAPKLTHDRRTFFSKATNKVTPADSH